MELTIAVRHLHKLDDYDECVRMQASAWGFAPLEIVPAPIFVVAAETGGQVLGAFAPAGDARDSRAPKESLIGFTMALAAMRGPTRYLHSHMTAVLADWRDKGVARRLKLAQRDDALARGIALVEWTFDPLEVKNAYFNLAKLGAIVRRYIPNCYGLTTSPLHANLPTDRLMADWFVASQRAQTILSGHAPPVSTSAKRIRVPGNIAELKKNDPQAAASEQSRIREEFHKCLAEGFAAVGFERESDGSGVYLLEKDSQLEK